MENNGAFLEQLFRDSLSGDEEEGDLLISRIMDGLFCGNYQSGRELEFIETNKVSHIINCSGCEVRNVFASIGMKYLTFYWQDKRSTILFDEDFRSITKVCRFIRECHDAGECVLIHSLEGTSRCCAMVVAYLMYNFKWPYTKSEKYLRVLHPDTNIRPYFEKQLQQLSSQWSSARSGNGTMSVRQERQQALLSNTFVNCLQTQLLPSYAEFRKEKSFLPDNLSTDEDSTSSPSSPERKKKGKRVRFNLKLESRSPLSRKSRKRKEVHNNSFREDNLGTSSILKKKDYVPQNFEGRMKEIESLQRRARMKMNQINTRPQTAPLPSSSRHVEPIMKTPPKRKKKVKKSSKKKKKKKSKKKEAEPPPYFRRGGVVKGLARGRPYVETTDENSNRDMGVISMVKRVRFSHREGENRVKGRFSNSKQNEERQLPKKISSGKKKKKKKNSSTSNSKKNRNFSKGRNGGFFDFEDREMGNHHHPKSKPGDKLNYSDFVVLQKKRLRKLSKGKNSNGNGNYISKVSKKSKGQKRKSHEDHTHTSDKPEVFKLMLKKKVVNSLSQDPESSYEVATREKVISHDEEESTMTGKLALNLSARSMRKKKKKKTKVPTLELKKRKVVSPGLPRAGSVSAITPRSDNEMSSFTNQFRQAYTGNYRKGPQKKKRVMTKNKMKKKSSGYGRRGGRFPHHKMIGGGGFDFSSSMRMRQRKREEERLRRQLGMSNIRMGGGNQKRMRIGSAGNTAMKKKRVSSKGLRPMSAPSQEDLSKSMFVGSTEEFSGTRRTHRASSFSKNGKKLIIKKKKLKFRPRSAGGERMFISTKTGKPKMMFRHKFSFGVGTDIQKKKKKRRTKMKVKSKKTNPISYASSGSGLGGRFSSYGVSRRIAPKRRFT